MQNRKTLLNISVSALFLALIIGFSYIPNLGYITIGPISFTTIHVIVLIGAMIFGKWKGALFGLFFGVFSLLVSLSYPSTINYLFVNPFVSVLPRVLFGFISGCVFDYFRKRLDKKLFLTICAPIAGILTIFHTFLTLSCLYIFGYLDIFKISQALGMMDIIEANEAAFGSFGNFILAFIAPGTVCEAAASIVLVPTVSSLYAYEKMPMNFYKLNVVEYVGSGDIKLKKSNVYLMIGVSVILVIALSATILTLFYLK